MNESDFWLTPGTGIRHIEMVPALLRREFGTGFAGDPIAEDGLLPLELARLVIGVDPVGDFAGVTSLS